MFVRGKGELKPKEGTTQADPIAMGLHSLSTTALMTAITSRLESMYHSSSNPFYIVALADDFTGHGKLESLKQ